LHAFVEFFGLYTCNDVRNVIGWFEGTVNIQSCKSKRNWLKYISKEDDYPLHNVPVSKLSFRAQALHWGRSCIEFSLLDPFVVQYRHMYKYLRELHAEIRLRDPERGRNSRLRRHETVWGGWQSDVVLWWNDWIRFGSAVRSLYLWGEPGSGKSSVIESITRGLRRYQPVPGQFFFGDYVVADVIVFEEFSEERFHGNWSQLKRVLECKTLGVDVKCQSRKEIHVKCPVILV
jgi:hypothetical protein